MFLILNISCGLLYNLFFYHCLFFFQNTSLIHIVNIWNFNIFEFSMVYIQHYILFIIYFGSNTVHCLFLHLMYGTASILTISPSFDMRNENV